MRLLKVLQELTEIKHLYNKGDYFFMKGDNSEFVFFIEEMLLHIQTIVSSADII